MCPQRRRTGSNRLTRESILALAAPLPSTPTANCRAGSLRPRAVERPSIRGHPTPQFRPVAPLSPRGRPQPAALHPCYDLTPIPSHPSVRPEGLSFPRRSSPAISFTPVQTGRLPPRSIMQEFNGVNRCRLPVRMIAKGVRRDKAALSSGCKPHWAIRSRRKRSDYGNLATLGGAVDYLAQRLGHRTGTAIAAQRSPQSARQLGLVARCANRGLMIIGGMAAECRSSKEAVNLSLLPQI
jgi:hypothetical protein